MGEYFESIEYSAAVRHERSLMAASDGMRVALRLPLLLLLLPPLLGVSVAAPHGDLLRGQSELAEG